MSVVDFKHASAALGREKLATVLLPGALVEGRSYPVYYLLHGWGGNRFSWLERASLAQAAAPYEMFIVMPEAGRRWFMNDHEGKPYETYVLDELMPAVEAAFPVSRDRSQRFIGGFSMGGASATFMALGRPDLFGAVVAHSGAFHASTRVGDPYAELRGNARLLIPDTATFERAWGPPGSETRKRYDADRIVDEFRASGATAPRFYLDVGTEDFPRMVEMVRAFRTKLTESGIAHEYRESAGGHDWPYVERALTPALAFLNEPSQG